MKVAWVLLLAVGVVTAKTQLDYQVPVTLAGVPYYQPNSGYSGVFSTVYPGNFGTESYSQAGYLGNEYYYGGYPIGNVQSVTSLGTEFNSAGSSGSSISSLGTGFQTQYASSSQYQNAEQSKERYEFKQQPAQVFKHFYVHGAPEEPEEIKPRVPIVLPPPQKHHKIIFVKAPVEKPRTRDIITIPQQNEEKTIVYVLLKKREEQDEVIVPKIEQKPPSKPEVYFVKYKTKEDSQAIINNIVNSEQVSSAVSDVGVNVDDTLNSISVSSDSSFNGGIQDDVSTASNSFGAGTSFFNPVSAISDSSVNEASIVEPSFASSTASSIDFTSAISTITPTPSTILTNSGYVY